MQARVAFSLLVDLVAADGETLFSGEAIYRPGRPHPVTGERLPMLGVPDDSLGLRPSPEASYRVRVRGEEIGVLNLYLERVSTCWWFVLDRPVPGVPRA
jgi:hypothetical protein